MKRTKTILVIAMLAIVSVASAQLSLGVKGGVGISNFYGEELNDKNAKVGFNIGVSAEYAVTSDFYVQSGLSVISKGSKYEDSALGVKGSFTTNPIYLQMPIHGAYKLGIAPATNLVFHAGPYLAYGIAGKETSSVAVGSVKKESKSDFFGKDGADRFDAGLGVGVGAEFGVISVDLGWDMGLVSLSKDSKLKNQNGYLTVGFRF